MLEPRIGKLDTFKSLILPVLYVGVPIGLVFLQPDLGTSLVYIAIFFCGDVILSLALKLDS